MILTDGELFSGGFDTSRQSMLREPPVLSVEWLLMLSTPSGNPGGSERPQTCWITVSHFERKQTAKQITPLEIIAAKSTMLHQFHYFFERIFSMFYPYVYPLYIYIIMYIYTFKWVRHCPPGSRAAKQLSSLRCRGYWSLGLRSWDGLRTLICPFFGDHCVFIRYSYLYIDIYVYVYVCTQHGCIYASCIAWMW